MRRSLPGRLVALAAVVCLLPLTVTAAYPEGSVTRSGLGGSIVAPHQAPTASASAAQKPAKPCNPKKPGCPDTTPPAIAIAAPASGATVGGLITVSGTASDNVSLASVEVQVDDGSFQTASGTANWSFALDTTIYADGLHSVRARATDTAGNVSPLSAISLNFSNSGPGPDVLVVGEVRVDRPTLHALGVQVLISGDENRNGRVDVRYRRAPDGEWTLGLPLMRVMPETIIEVVPQQFAGSLFDLEPATSYEIELRAADPDGAVDETRIVTAATRPVPRTDPASGRTINVENATTLRNALTAAQPGDVILMGPGTYSGTFVLTASGTADRPIVLRGWSTAGVILDGGNCRSCNVLEVSGSYVHVERFTIANAFRGLRFTGSNSTRNVARRLSISNVVHGTASSAGQTDFYICDNAIDGRLQWPWVFRDDATSHWDDRGIEVTGDGHVVCHNSVRGFGDPVLNMKRRSRAWDVYGNDIADAWDGVELDYGEGNVRLFHNRFTNAMAPVSIQPVYGGPAYALRNVAFNVPDEQVKLKSSGGIEEPSGALVYHNTFVSPERSLNLLSTITQHNFVFANNLFVGPESLWGSRSVDWRAGINHGVFDYNGYYPDGEFMFGTVAGVDRLFATFGQAQAAGVESGGVLVTNGVFEGGFVGPANEEARHDPQDFRLAVGSTAIDRGVRLPGINDRFTGGAPDLGALELGCPVPTYGPRPEGLEHFTWLINCPGAHSLMTSVWISR